MRRSPDGQGIGRLKVLEGGSQVLGLDALELVEELGLWLMSSGRGRGRRE